MPLPLASGQGGASRQCAGERNGDRLIPWCLVEGMMVVYE